MGSGWSPPPGSQESTRQSRRRTNFAATPSPSGTISCSIARSSLASHYGPPPCCIGPTEPIEVREGIEWALLPTTASEKTQATISTLYEIRDGYLVRVSMEHDHEGFGVDESTYFYAWQTGRWRLLAKA